MPRGGGLKYFYRKGGFGMKKQYTEKGRSPYATLSGGKIDAPHKPQGEPKAAGIRSSEDLRK